MSNEKKNPPTVNGTADGQETEQVEGLASIVSDSDDSTYTQTAQGKIPVRIESYLLRGSKNALTKGELVRMTGLVPRKVTQAVQDARRRGVPILSSSHPGGYFIAATLDEKRRFERSLRHRANETAITLCCLERAKVEDSTDGETRRA